MRFSIYEAVLEWVIKYILGVFDTMRNDDEHKLAISIPAAAKPLGISRNLAYQLARSGELPSVRLGRRLIVPKIALDKILGSVSANTTIESEST